MSNSLSELSYNSVVGHMKIILRVHTLVNSIKRTMYVGLCCCRYSLCMDPNLAQNYLQPDFVQIKSKTCNLDHRSGFGRF